MGAVKAREIWVKVDTIFGNDSAHYICMYWGTSAVGSRAHHRLSNQCFGNGFGGLSDRVTNGAAVFDTANGFQGVWHLRKRETAPTEDASSIVSKGPLWDDFGIGVPGVIGAARAFDGKASYIAIGSSLQAL